MEEVDWKDAVVELVAYAFVVFVVIPTLEVMLFFQRVANVVKDIARSNYDWFKFFFVDT